MGAIIHAALTCFAAKRSLLLAIVALGTEEARVWFAARVVDADPLALEATS